MLLSAAVSRPRHALEPRIGAFVERAVRAATRGLSCRRSWWTARTTFRVSWRLSKGCLRGGIVIARVVRAAQRELGSQEDIFGFLISDVDVS